MLELSRADLDVGMVAYDVPAMLHFYGDVIGLPRAGEMKLPGKGTIHKFLVGTNLVKVFEAEVELPKAPPTVYPWVKTGLQYWTVHVVDLDPIVARLAEHGFAPDSGVIDTGHGIRYMLLSDPDGNVVEFVEGDGKFVPKPLA